MYGRCVMQYLNRLGEILHFTVKTERILSLKVLPKS